MCNDVFLYSGEAQVDAVKIEVGSVYPTKGGGDLQVIDYKTAREVTVKFLDEFGYVTVAQASHIRRGNVKNPFARSVHGVGYIGEGKYKVSRGRMACEAYIVWQSMLGRCYNPSNLNLAKHYAGCTVQAEWHNFQKFAEWYSKQWKEEGWQIDKDLKVRYNRVYSKDNCLLLPSRINGLIIRHALKGELPTGVQLKGGRYYARVGTLDVRVSLGGFDTPEDAYEAYLKAKYEYIKILVVGKYSYLPESIKKYLLDWRV